MAGTYLALKPIPSKELKHLGYLLSDMEIKSPVQPKDLHVTLMYSENVKLEYEPVPNFMCTAYVSDIRILGEGKWRSIALILSCPSLHRKFDDLIKRFGKVHSYPDYTPHLSIKYDPSQDNIDAIERIRDRLLGLPITLSYEYMEDING